MSRSARNWFVGEGHLELSAARRRGVEEVEKREAERGACRHRHEEAVTARIAAIRAAEQTQKKLDEAEEKLRGARAHLAYRMSDMDDLQRQRAGLPPFEYKETS